MKKIIYYTTVDISEKNGQGIYAYNTIKSMLKFNNKMIIILPYPKDNTILNELQKKDSIVWDFLPIKKTRRNILWHLYIQILSIIKFISIGKVDIMVYSLKFYMIAPLIYSKLFRVDYDLLIEGFDNKMMGKFIKNNIFKLFLNKLIKCQIKHSRLSYPAYESLKYWIDELRLDNRSKVITCGIDEKIFIPAKRKMTKKMTIGFVGSFRDVHLINLLLESTQNYDIKVKLVGPKEIAKRFLKKFRKINKDNVEILGELEQVNLPNFFSDCDLMWGAIDINHWGVPIKVFEYLACNKKVIYTKSQTLSFIKDNKFGYELESNNIREVILLIENLLYMYKKKILIDNNSSEYINKNHNWNNFGKIILDEGK